MRAGGTTYKLRAFKWLRTTVRRDYTMHPKHNAHDKGHEKLSKGEADPRCMPREIRKVQVSKNIDALLSYAILREILYTRTTHVKMRVHRPTYIVLSRRKFRHIDTPKVRPRGPGTISEHAHKQDTAHGTQTSNIPKSHFHVPERRQPLWLDVACMNVV